jgi:type IV pilus assembly protein PilA
MMKSLKKKRKGGFTLIELIVVIAILAILAAVAIPRLAGFSDSAKISADKATFAALQSAIAIGVAHDDIGDGTITVKSAESTGVISITVENGDSDLIESGATFKVANNQNKSFTWTISEGEITDAPTIDDTTGEISNETE